MKSADEGYKAIRTTCVDLYQGCMLCLADVVKHCKHSACVIQLYFAWPSSHGEVNVCTARATLHRPHPGCRSYHVSGCVRLVQLFLELSSAPLGNGGALLRVMQLPM